MTELFKYRAILFGIATLWISLYHNMGVPALDQFSWYNDILKPSFMGYYGVDIFVFLSGAGLFYSFSKRPQTRVFYKKRLLRIFPSFYLDLFAAIPLILFLEPHILGQLINTAKRMLFYDVILKGSLSYLWFFSMLVGFYLIYPLWYAIQRRLNFTQGLTIALFIVVGFYIVTVLCAVDSSLWAGVNSRLLIFLLGSLLAQVNEKRIVSLLIPRTTTHGIAVLIGSLIMVIFHDYLKDNSYVYRVHFFFLTLYGLLTIFVIVPSLLFLLQRCYQYTATQALLKPIIFLGAISLECYIIDQGALRAYIQLLVPASLHPLLQSIIIMIYIILLAKCLQWAVQYTMQRLNLIKQCWIDKKLSKQDA